MLDKDFIWVVGNDVKVTMIQTDPDCVTSTYLIENAEGPGVIVVHFMTGAISVNGENINVFSGQMAEVLTVLADAVDLAPNARPGSAVTTRYEA